MSSLKSLSYEMRSMAASPSAWAASAERRASATSWGVAARRLGVSVRTLERILAEIEVTKRRRLFD